MMNPEIKKQWVAALRSGEYKQGTGQLRSKNNEFCCLGVLCDLHHQANPDLPEGGWVDGSYLSQSYIPPDNVFAWASINVYEKVSIGSKYESLPDHNDRGRTFSEIADAIEAQL